jgi:hypothetical protein
MLLVFWIVSLFNGYKEKINLANAGAAKNYESILWIAAKNLFKISKR